MKKIFLLAVLLSCLSIDANAVTYAYNVSSNYDGRYALASRANFAANNKTGTSSNYNRSGKYYLNPGHGGFDSNDRPTPMPLLGGEYLYESETNLDRGFHLRKFIQYNGGQVKFSREANNSSNDLALSTIASYSSSYGGYFLSLHSNGANASANYHIALYKGSNSTNSIGGSKTMAYQNSYEAYKNGCLTNATYTTPRSMADYDLMGWHYGVLKTNTAPGFLVETWFHDYRPEALRFKNSLYNKFLAWQMAVAFLKYPGASGNLPACIVGDVRDVKKSCGYTSYVARGRDLYLALNNVTVNLYNSSGSLVESVNTGNKCNGIFAFFVEPGTYSVEIVKDGYKTQRATVTATANVATVKQFDMVEGSNSSGITASTYNVNLSCAVGKTATAEVTLDGYLLNKWTTVTVTDNGTGYFKVSPEGLNVSGYTHDFDPENPKITITFSPDKVGSWGGDVNGDGFTDYYVTLHSVDTEGKDVYQWIALNGTALEPKITASTYVVKLNCAVGETASAEVTLDGQLLNKWTTVKVTDNNTGYFKVSPEGLNVSGYTHNFDPVNPKITITFAPKDSGFYGGDIDGDGYRDYFVTLQTVGTNGEDVYQWIGIEGTAYENSAPYIKADEYFPNFECLVGDTISQDFVLDGYSLNKWTTVEVSDAAKGIFSVTPNGLNVSGYTHDFDPKNPVITVKFHPDKEGSWDGDIDNDGYNDFFVRLHSVDTEGKDVYSWIMLKGKATKPYIEVSDFKPEFECEVGDTVTTEIAIDGYALNSWTTVSITENCTDIFSVSPTGLIVSGHTNNFDPENPVLTIKFHPYEAGSWGGDVDGDGYQDYFITLHSLDLLGKDVYQWIILKATATGNPTQINNVTSDEIFSIHLNGTELTVSGIYPNRLELLNTNGAIVADCDNSSTLNVKHIQPGVYITKIYTSDNRVISHKIMIK